jgi:hypothetical protein
MRHSRNSGVSEAYRLCLLMRLQGMFQSLPRPLMSRQVFTLPLLRCGTVGMCRNVVQLRRPLVVFVMGAVVVSRRHN